MRSPILIALSSLAVALFACSGSSSGSGGTSGGAGGGAPECGSTCTYYLQCKGADSSNQALCVQKCAEQGWTSEQLKSMEGLDCPSFITAIEGNPTPPPGSSGTSGTS